MSELTQIGTLIKVNPSEYFGDNNFEVRKFWLEVPADDPQYDSQFLEFQLTDKRCDNIAKFNIGDEIEVYFNLRGRKWTGADGVEKCFNSLNAWRLSAQTQEGQPAPQEQQNNGQQNNSPQGNNNNQQQGNTPAQNNNPQHPNKDDQWNDDGQEIPF